MTLTYKRDQDLVKMNRHAEYLGQMPFRLKAIRYTNYSGRVYHLPTKVTGDCCRHNPPCRLGFATTRPEPATYVV